MLLCYDGVAVNYWLCMMISWHENTFHITDPLCGESTSHWYQMAIRDFRNCQSRYRYWKIWFCSNALCDHYKIHIWLCISHVDGSVQDCNISTGDTESCTEPSIWWLCSNHMTIMCSVIIPLRSITKWFPQCSKGIKYDTLSIFIYNVLHSFEIRLTWCDQHD